MEILTTGFFVNVHGDAVISFTVNEDGIVPHEFRFPVPQSKSMDANVSAARKAFLESARRLVAELSKSGR